MDIVRDGDNSIIVIQKRVELDFTLLNRLSGEVSMDAVASPYGPSMIDRYAECSMKKFHVSTYCFCILRLKCTGNCSTD